MTYHECSRAVIQKRIEKLKTLSYWKQLDTEGRKNAIRRAIDSSYPFLGTTSEVLDIWLSVRAEVFGDWDIPVTQLTKPVHDCEEWVVIRRRSGFHPEYRQLMGLEVNRGGGR